MFLPKCYVFNLPFPLSSSLVVMTYPNLINWNSCWISQKWRECQEMSEYKKGFNLLEADSTLIVTKLEEKSILRCTRIFGKDFYVVWKPMSLKIKEITKTIRQRSERKARLRFCKGRNKLVHSSCPYFNSCLSGILSGTL